MLAKTSWTATAFAAILALALALPAHAGDGTCSGEFLKIPVYSRGSSLSGSGVALAQGTGALFYNPAGISRSETGEFTLSHSELYQDLRLENLSLSIPLARGYGVGFAVTYLGYGDISGYDVAGNATGDLSAYSTVVTLAFSHQFSDAVYWGVAVKPVFEELAGYSARTVTFDLGLSVDFGQLTFGAQFANLGGGLEYLSESTPLPRTLRVGAAYRSLGGSVVSLAATGENNGDFNLAGGVEYLYSDNLTFRASYAGNVGDAAGGAGGLGLGLGLKLNPIRLDYSYRPQGELDASHQITATFLLGR